MCFSYTNRISDDYKKSNLFYIIFIEVVSTFEDTNTSQDLVCFIL